MKKKVLVCGFVQESNSFNPVLTGLDVFKEYEMYEGGEVPKKELCIPAANGMIEFFREKDLDICCGAVMKSPSAGPIDQGVAEFFLSLTLQHIRNADRLDGVAVALHGATVSDKLDDVCGYILERIRKEVGDDIPIAASFDLHGNMTEKIMRNADYVCGFQEYPHIDQRETGMRAAKVLFEHINGRIGKTVRVTMPMIEPPHGYNTTSGSLEKLKKKAKSMIQSGYITDYTIFEVQPWLDIPDLQSSVIVIADDEERAKNVAIELAKENVALCYELIGERLFDVDEVINLALLNKDGKPVILVDSSDSPNAGANGDSAYVIEKLLPYSKKLKAAVAVTDVAAVEKAFSLGVGAVADFTLGASLAPELSTPVKVKKAQVVSLHDGKFLMYGPQAKGTDCFVGKTAVLRVDKLLIHVSSCGKMEGDINFYKSFGIDPMQCELVSVKACTSFRAGYEPIASQICNTATPGAAGTNLLEMPFKNIKRPLFPFDEIFDDDISSAKTYR